MIHFSDTEYSPFAYDWNLYLLQFWRKITSLTLLWFCISVVEPGRPAWRKIIQHFGDDILHEDQTLNRDKMAQIIFNDASKRRLLNSITHPEIYKSIVWSVIRLFLTGEKFSIDPFHIMRFDS